MTRSTIALLGLVAVIAVISPKGTNAQVFSTPAIRHCSDSSGFFPISEKKVWITAYSSTPDQTDDTPFITAYDTPVREGIVATNILPKGTMVRIPEIFGDKIFVVEDRMARRKKRHLDIWMPSRQEALNFGRRPARIQVLGPTT